MSVSIVQHGKLRTQPESTKYNPVAGTPVMVTTPDGRQVTVQIPAGVVATLHCLVKGLLQCCVLPMVQLSNRGSRPDVPGPGGSMS